MTKLIFICGIVAWLFVSLILFDAQQDPTQRNWRTAAAGAEMAILGTWGFSLAKRRQRALRKMRAGFCSCGYLLTGNVSGICPECGSAVPSIAANMK
jgi:4-amino-4-deoxy-L-arabinose transferase-like glycosyltransferase